MAIESIDLDRSVTNNAASAGDVSATLNYLGEIEGQARYDIRDVIKGTWDNSNIAWNSYPVTIHDVRPYGDTFTMDNAGFEFIKHQSQYAESPELFESNLREHTQVAAGMSKNALYEQELCDFIKARTGAREVFPQLGGLLTRTSLRAKTKGWARPAYHVHLDFTAQAAQQMLDQTLAAQGAGLPPSAGTFSTRPGGRCPRGPRTIPWPSATAARFRSKTA